jgi:parallel beta-helix repeat protein
MIALTGTAHAGPLTPPVGPVAPTHKTLTEIEPRTPLSTATTPGDADSVFRITNPGSYYLTGNLTAPSGRSGIKIAANDVTIDLSGFVISGVAGSLDGIGDSGVARSRLTIRNGTITGLGGDGIDLALSSDLRVQDISASSNTGIGISVNANAVVSNCTATSNLSAGFRSGAGVSFINCMASLNIAQGFAPGISPSGSFLNCSADDNGNIGFHGFGTYSFTNCTATRNGSDGFFVGHKGASFTNCTAMDNTSDGFFTLIGTLNGCTSRSNTGDGISALIGTVVNCVAEGNGSHGISVESRSSVINCSASSNGTAVATGAGIRVAFGDCRIDGNNVSGNDRGIETAAAGNIVIRNTAAANGINFVLAANTVFGPIVDRSAPGSAAVSGSSAASSLGTTDPNANFAY